MKKTRFIPLIVYLLLLSLVFSFVLNIFRTPVKTLPYSGIVSMIENGNVKNFVVEQLDKKYTDLLRYTGRAAYEK